MLRRDFVAPGRAVFLAAALSFGAPPLHAQTTFVRIVPDRRIVLTADAGGRYLDVTVYFCSFPPDVYDIYSRVIEANSQNVTANFSEPVFDALGCDYTGEVSDHQLFRTEGRVYFPAGAQSLTIRAKWWDFTGHESADLKSYEAPEPRRGIAVVSAAGYRTVTPAGSSQTATFTVTNSGNALDTLSITRTCTGAAAGSCGSPSPASLILAAGASGTVIVGFTAGGAGTTGSIQLVAQRASNATFADSAWTELTVGTAPAAGVVIAGTAPGVGDVMERSLCVTIAVADDAASECGDLRLTYGLPVVRTMNQVRAPTLLYNSQHARRKPIVLADITLPSGQALPTTVTACITISGASRGCTGAMAGSQWGAAGNTRRVAIPGVDSAWTTGTYAITVSVTFTGASYGPYTATGRLAVVDRSASPLRRGLVAGRSGAVGCALSDRVAVDRRRRQHTPLHEVRQRLPGAESHAA